MLFIKNGLAVTFIKAFFVLVVYYFIIIFLSLTSRSTGAGFGAALTFFAVVFALVAIGVGLGGLMVDSEAEPQKTNRRLRNFLIFFIILVSVEIVKQTLGLLYVQASLGMFTMSRVGAMVVSMVMYPGLIIGLGLWCLHLLKLRLIAVESVRDFENTFK